MISPPRALMGLVLDVLFGKEEPFEGSITLAEPPLIERLMKDPSVRVWGSTPSGRWHAEGYGECAMGTSIRAAVAALAEKLR